MSGPASWSRTSRWVTQRVAGYIEIEFTTTKTPKKKKLKVCDSSYIFFVSFFAFCCFLEMSIPKVPHTWHTRNKPPGFTIQELFDQLSEGERTKMLSKLAGKWVSRRSHPRGISKKHLRLEDGIAWCSISIIAHELYRIWWQRIPKSPSVWRLDQLENHRNPGVALSSCRKLHGSLPTLQRVPLFCAWKQACVANFAVLQRSGSAKCWAKQFFFICDKCRPAVYCQQPGGQADFLWLFSRKSVGPSQNLASAHPKSDVSKHASTSPFCGWTKTRRTIAAEGLSCL